MLNAALKAAPTIIGLAKTVMKNPHAQALAKSAMAHSLTALQARSSTAYHVANTVLTAVSIGEGLKTAGWSLLDQHLPNLSKPVRAAVNLLDNPATSVLASIAKKVL